MIISDKYQIVYIAPPKTGTTTITNTLINFFDAYVLKSPYHVSKHDSLLPKRFAGYFKFMSVRNPYELEVSRFLHRARKQRDLTVENQDDDSLSIILANGRTKQSYLSDKRFNIIGKSFKYYVNNVMRHEDIYYPYGGASSISACLTQRIPKGHVKFNVDMIIRTEQLEKDFNQLPFVEDRVKLPIIRKILKSHRLYTKSTADIVYNLRKVDFDNFGYDKECPDELFDQRMPLL